MGMLWCSTREEAGLVGGPDPPFIPTGLAIPWQVAPLQSLPPFRQTVAMYESASRSQAVSFLFGVGPWLGSEFFWEQVDVLLDDPPGQSG